MPLLFLDFDGVLHPAHCETDLLFCRNELLELWLRERQDVDVVISSSWREPHPLPELRAFFSDDIAPRIVGATPRSIHKAQRRRPDGTPGPEREAEIRDWLQRHGRTAEPWVALDDQAFRFRKECRHLVLCNPQVGLTHRELVAAEAVLRYGSPP